MYALAAFRHVRSEVLTSALASPSTCQSYLASLIVRPFSMEGESIALPREPSFVWLEWCLGEVAFLKCASTWANSIEMVFPKYCVPYCTE